MARRRRHRTMTPAALAANRRNLEKARAARSRAAAQKAPTKLAIRKAPISSNKTQIKAASQKALSTKAIEGKKPTAKVGEEMVTLYHRTTPAAAKKIVKEVEGQPVPYQTDTSKKIAQEVPKVVSFDDLSQ